MTGLRVASAQRIRMEALCDLPGLQAVKEVRPEGFVLAVGPHVRHADEFSQVNHGNTCSLDTIPHILHDLTGRKSQVHETRLDTP